jgi:hypothetical protein
MKANKQHAITVTEEMLCMINTHLWWQLQKMVSGHKATAECMVIGFNYSISIILLMP